MILHGCGKSYHIKYYSVFKGGEHIMGKKIIPTVEALW
jgi:hypothetical protein